MTKRESMIPSWLRLDIFEWLTVVLMTVVFSIIVYSVLSAVLLEPNPIRWFLGH